MFALKIGGQQIPRRTILLALSEAILILAGLLASIAIRTIFSGETWFLWQTRCLIQFGIIALVCELCLYYSDIYDLQTTGHPIAMIRRLLHSFGFSCLILALLYAVAPGLALGRSIALIATPLIVIMIIVWRLLWNATGMMSGRAERVLVLGTGAIGICAVREICRRPELNLKVVGFLDEDPRNVGKPLVNPGIIGTTADLEQTVQQQRIQRVVLSLDRHQTMPQDTLLRLKFAGVAIEDAGGLLERITGRLSIERTNWLILSDGFRQSKLLSIIKRASDVMLSLILLVISMPVMLVIALAILAETGLPVLFRQTRIGLRREPFEILKFRSMYQNAEAKGPRWAADADRRITRAGRVLRKYRLDELPQLLNVLLGNMSLVGPRPEQPYFCEILEQKIPFFAQRYQVRPGITGWAQIKYSYGASVDDAIRKLELDLFYIKHQAPLLDIAILIETVKVVLFARGSK